MPNPMATWENSKLKIDLTLTESTDTAMDDSYMTTASEKKTEKADEDIAIYTDAACNRAGQCGIGIQ